MFDCTFCEFLGEPKLDRFVAANQAATAVLDGYPVSEGHTLVIPNRHVGSIFELRGNEQADVWSLVAEVRDKLKTSLAGEPEGFNIGPNDGVVAGQTVGHAHIHLIPRYPGDAPDPRGGIRWVLPRKANYWQPDQANPFQQVEFLGFVQSLLERGQFVSTYKFALLQALADLSLESEPDPGGDLSIPLRSIAGKFLAYYWCQAAPFHLSSGELTVLRQNQGPANIALLRILEESRKEFATFSKLQRSGARWSTLVSQTASQIRQMPLFKLQTIGGKQTETLYPNQLVQGSIVLGKGVQDCFRRFYGIVIRLVRREWLEMVRKLNPGTIGAPVDLEEFLFGSQRNLWPGIRDVLRGIQGGRCFFCTRNVPTGQEQLDHFIPWSLYPNDLAHNFVLACRVCNGRKSDGLAELEVFERWIERNRRFEREIQEKAEAIGLPSNAAISAKIAAWAYTHSGVSIKEAAAGSDRPPSSRSRR